MFDLEQLVQHFGYIAVFTFLALGIFGLPLPDEIVLTSIGYFSSTGLIHYYFALPITIIGVIMGTFITYYVGKKVGKPVLLKFGKWVGIKKKTIEKTEKWMNEKGSYTVFVGFLIPGLRHITCYVSGMSGMKTRVYLPYVIAGAIVSSILYLTIGYYAGTKFLQ